MKIKVMLVDDEPHIRMILRKVIEKKDEFQVVSECDTMADALIAFHQYEPEVIFMDIEIKGSSGIDCAKVISELKPNTKIIFATAHSEYMSNAFELYAFDYLVKPFNLERIDHTLKRILDQNQREGISNSHELSEEHDHTDHADITIDTKKREDVPFHKEDGKLIIKGKESMNFVDIEDIVLVERENNSTVIYTASGEQYTTSISMGDLEGKLDPKRFMRSHKSYIINISRIKSVEPYGRWTYVVKLKGIPQDALLTKEKIEQIRQLYT